MLPSVGAETAAAEMAARSHPLSQFVLKVHGRCDLSCDHCYVYEHADQSWRTKPRAMSPAIVRAAAVRMAEHAAAWHLPAVRVVLHGGEPLLLGPERMRAVLAELTNTVAPVARLDLTMQTNGIRLDPAMCDVLKEYSVRVGVSLDGDEAANDRHRRFANGAGSADRVRAALALLRTPAYREIYAGILCTIDVRNDPVRVYEALRAEQPPRVDFLLPHATWEDPPLRPTGDLLRPAGDSWGRAGDPTPYASWLSAIHRCWLADGRPMRIRMFDALRSTAGGGRSGSEQIGADAADLVVIDTDGRYEQADSIKTAYDGAPHTGLSVLSHPVDAVSRLAAIAVRQTGTSGLSAICRSCPVVEQCGGGLYAHRYRHDTGFDNPSVYCADLRALVDRSNEETAVHVAGSTSRDESVPVDLVDQIAGGFGDEPTMRWLAEQQSAVTRALLFGVVDQFGAPDSWDVLATVEAASPDAVRGVLTHPYVRAWAVDQLRGSPGTAAGYLGALAGAAAVHAGVAVETDVQIRAGVVHLPTVGTVYWPTGTTGPARLTVELGKLWITGPDRTLTVQMSDPSASDWWQPARWIGLDTGGIRLEDGDPERDCHRWTPTGRLGRPEEQAWRHALTEAWRLIQAELPGYAPALRAGLRTVVPLERDGAGAQRASTARNAFGSVAAAFAAPADLAVLLVHEFQHGKLGALLDLCDLFDPAADVRVTVGWRPDPRPVEGVLQGTYAHAAVADVWRGRAERDGGVAAREMYLKYLAWTTEAVAVLRNTGALTPLGIRFVDRLDTTMAGWVR